MKVKIGKLLPDSSVRYIEVESPRANKETINLLRNFYSTEERINALLDLGTLCTFGATPYGKRRYDRKSETQCWSYIRDEKKSVNKYSAKLTESREHFFKSKETCFLYENGCWEVKTNKNSLSGLTVYQIDSKGNLFLERTETGDWNTLMKKSKEENQTYYLFRNNQLVTTIFKPQLQ